MSDDESFDFDEWYAAGHSFESYRVERRAALAILDQWERQIHEDTMDELHTMEFCAMYRENAREARACVEAIDKKTSARKRDRALAGLVWSYGEYLKMRTLALDTDMWKDFTAALERRIKSEGDT